MTRGSLPSIGGKARAEQLSDERKQEIARMGAAARWSDRPIKATHKGNFKEQFGIDVDCYVLDDAAKTAVISQRGMGRAIGLSTRGNAFPRFLANKTISGALGAEIIEKLSQPIKFQWGPGGAETPVGIAHGLDVTLLIDLCRAIVQAESEGKLGGRHKDAIAQAHVILSASAKSGIKHLVYALAGYNPTAEEVIQAFKQYVQEEAKKYEREFPPELYQAWYRLYQIQPFKGRGRPWEFKKLTVDHVYAPLAQSNGKILELTRALKAKAGDRKKKLFQFLSEVGTRALRMHLGRVLEMAEDSSDLETYEKRVRRRFSIQREFEFTAPLPVSNNDATPAGRATD